MHQRKKLEHTLNNSRLSTEGLAREVITWQFCSSLLTTQPQPQKGHLSPSYDLHEVLEVTIESQFA